MGTKNKGIDCGSEEVGILHTKRLVDNKMREDIASITHIRSLLTKIEDDLKSTFVGNKPDMLLELYSMPHATELRESLKIKRMRVKNLAFKSKTLKTAYRSICNFKCQQQ